MRKYIFGGHISEYMEELMDDDEEKYRTLFKNYIADEIEAEDVEEIYTNAHEKSEKIHLSNQLKRNSPRNNMLLNQRNTDKLNCPRLKGMLRLLRRLLNSKLKTRIFRKLTCNMKSFS